MEVIIGFIVVVFIISIVTSVVESKIDTNKNDKTVDIFTPEIIDRENESTTTTNNFYIQQNIYIQQNNNYTSSEEHKDHSESVWRKMGYRVKYGQEYAYKMYGREIFTPDQVVKIDSNYEQLSLESGLTKNQKKVKQLGYALVNKYKSKRKAKDILVEHYDFDEKTAKFAAGYRGYENW